MDIECSSVVARVVVHARGALVTREVELPQDLPSGVVDVAMPGVTLHAESGSARAALEESERIVSHVHTALVLPSTEIKPGPTITRVRELTARAARLGDEHRLLTERRTRLVDLALAPHLRPIDERKRERDVLDVRFGDALRVAELIREKVGSLDETLARLEAEQRSVAKDLEAARLEDAQASAHERLGTAHPTNTITVRLTGEGRPGRLAVTYAVYAARWWPSYTLRMEDGGRRATWIFEALVAQRSGEDWSQVALALSSADLVFDARLPELHSLRFGRAQPPRRRPYRAPPAGADEMFEAYLRFGGKAFTRTMPPPAPPKPKSVAPVPMTLAATVDLEEEQNMEDAVTIVTKADALGKKRLPAPAPPAGAAPPPPPPASGAAGGLGPPPMQNVPMVMPAASRGEMMTLPRKSGGLLAGIGGLFEGGGGYVDQGAVTVSDMRAAEPEPEIIPSATWSDHDTLVLADADDAAHRGKLVPRRDAEAAGRLAQAVQAIDRAVPERAYDPLASRGMFDHRYDAAGRGDVPADGRVHRVAVSSATSSVTLAWRTVPCESPEVYREAHLVNPFDTALLGGPVDVQLDGNLLTTTMIDRIDRGGSFHCGMGVDDRVKVARNVRVEEESAGLLGGSTAVTHTIDIELSSTIADVVKVTVLERVPVSDDKSLEIKLVNAKPPPETYDQADRSEPIRGGLRFVETVTAATKRNIQVVYKLVFASKLDIVGGSRRG